MDNTIYLQIINSIIAEQQTIVGPLAPRLAHKVMEMKFNAQECVVGIDGDPEITVDKLVSIYESLFGESSKQVCKDAASRFLSQLQTGHLPTKLV